MQGAERLVLQIPRAQPCQGIGAGLIGLPGLIAAAGGITGGNGAYRHYPEQQQGARVLPAAAGGLSQPLAQGQLDDGRGIGKVGGGQLPIEGLMGSEACLLPCHDEAIQCAAGISLTQVDPAIGRNGQLPSGLQAATKALQRQPQQQKRPSPQQRCAALEGGIVAHEIAEALRHAGDHLFIALPLVYPAVDLEAQIPGYGGVGLHQVLVLALGAAQGTGEILGPGLQLGVLELIGIDPAGRGCRAQRHDQRDGHQQRVDEVAALHGCPSVCGVGRARALASRGANWRCQTSLVSSPVWRLSRVPSAAKR
ncbi:hypothetical protein D3C87_1226400 [compost metagenome]